MTKQASLPMYDFPEVRKATDAWWSGVAKYMRQAGVENPPTTLQHDIGVKALWEDENLFLSQCCGFDVVFGFKDTLTPLLITDWHATGCEEGQYSSWIVVHEDSDYQHLSELYNKIAVINSQESHSGMHALLALVQPYSQVQDKERAFFRHIHESGAHVDSLAAVIAKQADVAAIDCITYALLKEYRPTALSGTRIIGQTDYAPAHPYVTRSHTSTETQQRMKEALNAAFNDHALNAARDTILLKQGLFDRNNDYQKIADEFHYHPCQLDVLCK